MFGGGQRYVGKEFKNGSTEERALGEGRQEGTVRKPT